MNCAASLAVAEVSGGKYSFRTRTRTLISGRKIENAGDPAGTRDRAKEGSARHLGAGSAAGFANQDIAEDQRIHLRAQKTINRFFGPADDRFIVVEGRIQNDGHAGE